MSVVPAAVFPLCALLWRLTENNMWTEVFPVPFLYLRSAFSACEKLVLVLTRAKGYRKNSVPGSGTEVLSSSFQKFAGHDRPSGDCPASL